MDLPTNRPSPSYPANYAHQTTPTPPRKNSSGLSIPSLKGNRQSSFLSLASLNLAHSSSSLLQIFASGLDSVPPTPMGTPPPPEIKSERNLVESVNKWAFIKDIIRSISILFVMGYAFAVYLPLSRSLLIVDY
jgi:hypothetical protein